METYAETNFREQVTEKNETNNEGQKTIKDLKSTVSELGSVLSPANLELASFDINLAANSDKFSEISNQSEYLKAIVDGLAEIRDADNKGFGEQLIAKDSLKELTERIENNNDISTDQKELLLHQAKTLEKGFSTSAILLEQTKKSLGEYSDAAVAGITSFLGNSPATLFLSKILTDQVKNFFTRRKQVKENKARLIKADAVSQLTSDNSIDNKETNLENTDESVKQTKMMRLTRIKDAAIFLWMKKDSLLKSKTNLFDEKKSSVATQMKEETSREKHSLLKSKGGAKFKSTIARNPFMKMLKGVVTLFGGILLRLVLGFSPLIRILGLFGTAIAGAFSMFKNFKLPKIFGGPSKVPSKVPGSKALKPKPSKVPSKVPGSKALKPKPSKVPSKLKTGAKSLGKNALGAGRFLGHAAAVAGAAYGGWEAGSYINKNYLTNKDGSGKIANGVYDFINGSDDERKSNFSKEKDDLAVTKGFKNWDEMISHNKKSNSSKNGKASRVPHKSNKKNDLSKSLFIKAETVNISSRKSQNMDSLITERKNKLTAERASLVDGVQRGSKELREAQATPDKQTNSPVVVTTSNVNNSNQTNIIPSMKPSNPEPTFISIGQQGSF